MFRTARETYFRLAIFEPRIRKGDYTRTRWSLTEGETDPLSREFHLGQA